MTTNKTFFYFAYGSNLLKERIRINNPTATFISTGFLDNFKLSFFNPIDEDNVSYFSWQGGTASITPTKNSHVYGSIWELNMDDLKSLDKQEGVPKAYFPIDVHVRLPSNEIIQCRSYRMCCTESRKPSPYYLDIILRGAFQCELPEDYIEDLMKLEHNDYLGQCPLYWKVLQSSSEINISDFKVEVLKNIA